MKKNPNKTFSLNVFKMNFRNENSGMKNRISITYNRVLATIIGKQLN